jgi:hypothetical protein
MAHVAPDDLLDWRFEIRERSAGVYEGSGMHVSGATVRASGDDPDDLLDRLRRRLGSSLNRGADGADEHRTAA